MNTTADHACRPSNVLNSNPPIAPPLMMATNVPSSRMPLPHDSRLFGQQFRQQSVFRWPEERAVHAHEQHAAHGHRQIVQQKPSEHENHHADLKQLHADGDRAFAEAVGQITARHREQDERRGEQDAQQRDNRLALPRRCRHAQTDEGDQRLERVVAERALKLRDDQTPETAVPGLFRSASCHEERSLSATAARFKPPAFVYGSPSTRPCAVAEVP